MEIKFEEYELEQPKGHEEGHAQMPRRYELALVVADIISARCPGTSARARFLRTCIGAKWGEATSMVDGLLAEPSRLRGHQERRLREFLDLISGVQVDQRAHTRAGHDHRTSMRRRTGRDQQRRAPRAYARPPAQTAADKSPRVSANSAFCSPSVAFRWNGTTFSEGGVFVGHDFSDKASRRAD